MEISNLSNWFWPALSFLLANLWLWTLLRRDRTAPTASPPTSGSTYWPVEAEDVLKAACALQETQGAWDSEQLAHSIGLSEALTADVVGNLITSGWIEEDFEDGMRLTKTGEARAQEMIRAHRLWERYLVDQKGMPLEVVHAEAHQHEHQMTTEELERLDARLGHPAWDPHGHAIPAQGCRVPPLLAHPMLEKGTPGSRLRVVCLDDESAPLLAQLIVLGLNPGVDVEVLERKPDLLQLQIDENVVPLAAAAARHVFVVPTPTLPVPLGELPVGVRAEVVETSGSGKHQRRMLDMGFVPGAEVAVIRKAPLGDPIEYRVKETSVALRREDAGTILVEELRDE